MQIKIDVTGTFQFNGGREAVVDLYQLYKLREKLHETKGVGETKSLDKEEMYVPEITAFIKQSGGGIDINEGEAIGVFNSAYKEWAAKKKSWYQDTDTPPTSPPSSDPRYAE